MNTFFRMRTALVREEEFLAHYSPAFQKNIFYLPEDVQ